MTCQEAAAGVPVAAAVAAFTGEVLAAGAGCHLDPVRPTRPHLEGLAHNA
ncbi:MAG: hypothetical protein RBG13Loki_1099 [Promethearchaeota archaeon CR_4]|nr:MAG: hypothetical protein RBG13Loki_1099 [Candidatus Lokiarchaeota archaeon CR_4]